jgi:hypothetical protein
VRNAEINRTQRGESSATESREDHLCLPFVLPYLEGEIQDRCGDAPLNPILRKVDQLKFVIKDKNHPAYGDKHPSFGIAGGENDVAEVTLFLKALLDIKYVSQGKQNIVAFEVKPMTGETPETVIANAKRTLMEAWARL